VGTAISVERGRDDLVSFRVDESFKGVQPSEVVRIATTGDRSSCRLGVDLGDSILVYASRSQSQLRAHRCAGTAHIRFAWPDLFYLRALNREALIESLCPPGTEPYAHPHIQPEGLPGLYCWSRDVSGGVYPDGPGILWRHEGWRFAQGTWRQGARHGRWTYFNRDGSVKLEEVCDAGECLAITH
jgi:hypothetical protein